MNNKTMAIFMAVVSYLMLWMTNYGVYLSVNNQDWVLAVFWVFMFVSWAKLLKDCVKKEQA